MKPRKRFGQHFLEPAWVDRLVAAIAPGADESFLEIGPGRGALTLPLARRARHVVAVEIDRDLVAWLRPRLPDNATLVEGDALTLPASALLPADTAPAAVRVVGNLPYYISTPILFRLLALRRTAGAFQDACVMLQAEVAERVSAAPGSRAWGVLSVAIQLDADVSVLLWLPPGAFRPAPAVSSAVVRLRFRPPAVQLADRAVFDGMVRAMFAQRRKTSGNALKAFAGQRGADAAAVLRLAGVDPGRRPETLTLAELAGVAGRLAALPLPPTVV